MYNSKNNFISYFLRENIWVDHTKRPSKANRYKSDSVSIKSKLPGRLQHQLFHMKGDKGGGAIAKSKIGDGFLLFREPSAKEAQNVILPAIHKHIEKINKKNATLPKDQQIKLNVLTPSQQSIQRNLYTQLLAEMGLIDRRYVTKVFMSKPVQKAVKQSASTLGEVSKYKSLEKQVFQLFKALEKLGITDEMSLFKLEEMLKNAKFALLDRFGYEFYVAFTREVQRVADRIMYESYNPLNEETDFDAEWDRTR